MCLLPPYLPPSVPVTNCAPYPVSLGINKLGIQNVSVAGGEAQLVLVLVLVLDSTYIFSHTALIVYLFLSYE